MTTVTKLTTRQLADLGKLAVDRCRDAFMTVGQLVEDDEQRAVILIAAALDFTRGAASMYEESQSLNPQQATTVVVSHLLRELGIESVTATVIGKRKAGVKTP